MKRCYFNLQCLLTDSFENCLSAGANSAHLHKGLPYIQTGFLVGRFVFSPTQVASKTFRETNHTADAFFCVRLA